MVLRPGAQQCHGGGRTRERVVGVVPAAVALYGSVVQEGDQVDNGRSLLGRHRGGLSELVDKRLRALAQLLPNLRGTPAGVVEEGGLCGPVRPALFDLGLPESQPPTQHICQGTRRGHDCYLKSLCQGLLCLHVHSLLERRDHLLHLFRRPRDAELASHLRDAPTWVVPNSFSKCVLGFPRLHLNRRAAAGKRLQRHLLVEGLAGRPAAGQPRGGLAAIEGGGRRRGGHWAGHLAPIALHVPILGVEQGLDGLDLCRQRSGAPGVRQQRGVEPLGGRDRGMLAAPQLPAFLG
mmetsp:Transcript_106774/g.340924  ORF Transcript_106774/g.340924 Transcript_106774/m.340924 type:complete len:292 (+) Transcript_106774:445-1320(+)